MKKESLKRFTVSFPVELAEGAFAKAASESRTVSNYFQTLARNDIATGAPAKRPAKRKGVVA